MWDRFFGFSSRASYSAYMTLKFSLTLLLFGLSGLAGAAVAQPNTSLEVRTCGNAPVASPVSVPLPALVSVRVAFYIAEYDRAGRVLQAQSLGDINAVHPIASTYKGLLLEAVMREVDAGRLSLKQVFKTTDANRSIEGYPAGTNTLQVLAERAIHLSDNTAADILQLAYGPDKLARLVQERSSCTQVMLTTKGMWAFQSGLIPQVSGDVVQGSRAFAALPFNERVKRAAVINQAAQGVLGPDVEQALDVWFKGSQYTPQVDLDLQPTSTAKALTDLVARTFGGQNLSGSRAMYRKIMQTGCCRPRQPRLKTSYWGAKAGSGWRVLTETGYVELPGGRMFAYTYLNDLSEVDDSDLIEPQLRPVTLWIEDLLMSMAVRK